MVHLCELRDEPGVVDTLDDVELPQRTPAIERTGNDTADDFGELLGGTGRWHGVMTNVKVDVELGVLNPIRQVEPERHLHEAPPKWSELIDAFENDLFGCLEPGSARCICRIEDIER